MLTNLCLAKSNRPGRVACDDRAWPNVLRDDCSGSDDGPVADPHSGQNAGAGADKSLFPDLNVADHQFESGRLEVMSAAA